MADIYESGAGGEVAGASRALEDVSREELLTAMPARPVRPHWMVTRYPVDMPVYDRLVEEARQPDLAAASALEGGTPPDTDELEAGAEPEVSELSRGEDEPGAEPAVAAAPPALAPSTIASFAGIPATGWQPPDNTCAVGPNDVMLAVNTDLAVYSKAGALRFRWPNMTTLFRPVLPANAGVFDPRVAYDHYAQRWIVVVAARRESPAGSWLMVGVSQTPNPGGAYWVWALDAMVDGSNPTSNWADYPMLGFDTQAIYIVSNMFRIGGGFQYCKLRILNKAELYGGGVGPGHTVRWYDFWNLRDDGGTAFTVQPCVHFRGTGGNPPGYFVSARWGSGNTLSVWTLNNPLALWTSGAPSLSRDTVSCRGYDLPPQAIQKDSATRIATNDNRLLNAIYQHAGGVQRLWTCHTSKFTWAGDSEARSVVQWYEVDVPTKKVVQQNAYGASGRYYFFPAIQTDLARNAYVVFSRSAADEFGSLRQTGRRVAAPANDLENSVVVRAGASAYNGGRWGDYFGICRDGGDSNAVWIYGEHAEGGGQWGTWAAGLRF